MSARQRSELERFLALAREDPAALQELSDRLRRCVFWVLNNKMANGRRLFGDIDDIVSEARLRLERLRGRGFRGGAPEFKAYLYKVVATACIDAARDRRFTDSLDAPIALPDGDEKPLREVAREMVDGSLTAALATEAAADARRIREAVERLEPRCRHLIWQFHVEERPIRELADAEGTRVNTIEVALVRCRTRLYARSCRCTAKDDLNRAKSEAESARTLAPNDVRVHLALGQVLLKAHDFPNAEASFSRALEIAPTSGEARREWDRSVKIRQASPGTLVGKRIALADPITRGELAALLATELNIETHLRKRRPELFHPSFRPPTRPTVGPAPPIVTEPTDTTAHWARNAIALVTRLSLMDAYPDRSFRLARTLEQVLVVVANDRALRTRYLGQTSPFPDVRSDQFAFNSALVVTTRGLMEADRPSGAFRPVTPVSGPDALLAMRKLAELF